MISPMTRNSQSGALRLPDTIRPAISTRTSPSPVETSQTQFCSSVRTSPTNALPPCGATPESPAAFNAQSRAGSTIATITPAPRGRTACLCEASVSSIVVSDYRCKNTIEDIYRLSSIVISLQRLDYRKAPHVDPARRAGRSQAEIGRVRPRSEISSAAAVPPLGSTWGRSGSRYDRSRVASSCS